MIKITFLILCLQAIHWVICWDLKSPLILNKKEDKVFFPNYVNFVEDPKSSSSEITYKNPEDKTVSTYTFCRVFPTPPQGFPGMLLSEDKKRSCKIKVDSHSQMYTREQVKDANGNPVPCRAGEEEDEVTGWQYKVYFKVQIDDETYTQNSYDYCYDHKNLNTLYAYYDLENPNLLKNEYLTDEQNYQFFLESPNIDGPAEVDLLPHYQKRKDYKPFEVAISEFIPFAHWRISFHQWDNKAPIYFALHDPWKAFIKNIRSKLAEKTEPIKVLSGIHGITRSQGLTVHLSGNIITIPTVWWVILYDKDKNQGIAFIMHNYTAKSGHDKPNRWCEESKCNDAGLKDVVPKEYERKTMMYCCSPADIAEEVQLSGEIFSATENLMIFQGKNV